jgi:hypothetical protein
MVLQLIILPAAKFAVIHFLHTKNTSASEIHCKLWLMAIVMREGTVRQWCRMLKAVKTNIHGEEQL